MNDRNPFQQLVDRNLSGLQWNERRKQKVLHATEQERRPIYMKKKTMIVALALVLCMTTSVALAVATIRETGHLFAQTEQEFGDYADWPAEKKATVVRELMDEGYIKDTEERKLLREGRLTQEEVARISDEAISEFTGEEAKYASFLSIMSAAWGPFEEWSQEQKAWYSQVLADTGAQMDGKTYYVEAEVAISDQEAVAIAKKAIARGFAMDESLLDKYRVYEVSLQIPEFTAQGNTKAYWYVAMDTLNTELENQEGLPFHMIDVFVDPDTGELLESIEEKVAAIEAAQNEDNHPLTIAIREFEASINEPKAFHTWTLEHKARWSEEIAPLIKEYVEANGDSTPLVQGDEMKLSFAYTYGLPDEKAISQEKAMDIAQDALVASYGLSDEEVSLLMDNGLSFDEPAMFYDVTDSEHPLWKLIFTMPSIYCSDDAVAERVQALYGQEQNYNRYYMVEINAYTESVTRTLAVPIWPDMVKDF